MSKELSQGPFAVDPVANVNVATDSRAVVVINVNPDSKDHIARNVPATTGERFLAGSA